MIDLCSSLYYWSHALDDLAYYSREVMPMMAFSRYQFLKLCVIEQIGEWDNDLVVKILVDVLVALQSIDISKPSMSEQRCLTLSHSCALLSNLDNLGRYII